MDAKCNTLRSLGRIYTHNYDDHQIGSFNQTCTEVPTLRLPLYSMPALDTKLIMTALFDGLEDYTTDQRGEVGSLVRNICLEQITNIILLQHDQSRLDPGLLDALVFQLLKQSVEKLDIVREQAGRELKRLSGIRKIVSE